MNPKNETKSIVDMLMAADFLLLMNVPVTGVLLHEWIGAGLVAAVFVHLALNRKWIAGVARRFKSAGTKAKGRFVLDTAIAVAAGACVVTGLLISRFLFPRTVSADRARTTPRTSVRPVFCSCC